jgi:hypothetical protein
MLKLTPRFVSEYLPDDFAELQRLTRAAAGREIDLLKDYEALVVAQYTFDGNDQAKAALVDQPGALLSAYEIDMSRVGVMT